MDDAPGLRREIENPLSVIDELEKLKKELITIKDLSQRKEALRKIARLERFDRVQS
jgi:hypothetical protein